MADDWAPITQATTGDDWQPASAPAIAPNLNDPSIRQIVQNKIGRVWGAFTDNYEEGIGGEHGMSQKDFEWFQEHGLYRKDDKLDGLKPALQAIFEGVSYPAFSLLSDAIRAGPGIYRGLQGIGVELGLPRDIVSVPDAFLGTPHPTGVPRDVARVMAEPEVREAIANPRINRANDVPYEAGASARTNVTNIDRHIPDQATISDVTFDPAIPANIHEQVEKFITNVLTEGGMDNESAYRVAHWEYGEKAEDAWYQSNGIDIAAANKWWEEQGGKIDHTNPPNPPADLFTKPYHGAISADAADAIRTEKPSLEEVAQAQQIIGRSSAEFAQGLTQTDLYRARELGIIGPPKASIQDGTPAEAAEAATQPYRVEAAKTRDDVLRGPEPNPAVDKAGNIRLDLIETGEDAKNIIRQAAEEHGGFVEARQGDIPLGQIEALSQVTGMPVQELSAAGTLRGMGRLMRNDNEVRSAIQAMIQSAEDTAAKMKQAAFTKSDADLIAFQEARMRHSFLQEQVAGLTAEWGRTGNVFQEFRERVKDAKTLGEFIKEKKGETIDDLRNMVDLGSTLDPRTQLPKFLNDSRKPNFWDKFLFYWTNALISGPFTHTGYAIANTAFAAYEGAVVTPIAGAVGAARRAAGLGEVDRVFIGEAAARLWGLIAGTPEALKASWTAAKNNIQTPLPGEVAKEINPIINQKPNPIGGLAGTIIGIPSRGAAGIHSFFNFLGYRAEIEAQAYRAAAKEGLAPGDPQFWERYGEHSDRPSEAAMDKAIENGYRLTFITELGENAKAFQRLTNMRVLGTQPLKLIFPFLKVPIDLMKRAYEQTPAALLDSDMREAIMGKKGGAEQDMAIGRILGGSLVMTYLANMAINDRVTGDGPTDPAERKRWMLTHQANSIRVGDNWIRYSRFGPIGDLAGIAANMVEVGPSVKEGEYTEAVGHTLKAASRLVLDEVGMQGLVNIIEATTDPDHKGARFASNFAGTMLPFSTGLRQTASAMEPYMRDAKTFVDQLRTFIPGQRERVMPKRDWLGREIDNPAYGAILRSAPAVSDPLADEMQRLEITPTIPKDMIRGVKLTPEMFDRYQATAGPMVKMALDAMVNSPGWQQLPDFQRETAIRKAIESMRGNAAGLLQAENPALIEQALRQQIDHITGVTHKKRPKEAPPIYPNP